MSFKQLKRLGQPTKIRDNGPKTDNTDAQKIKENLQTVHIFIYLQKQTRYTELD